MPPRPERQEHSYRGLYSSQQNAARKSLPATLLALIHTAGRKGTNEIDPTAEPVNSGPDQAPDPYRST